MSQHDDEILGKAYDAELMRRLLVYLRPYWRAVLIAFVAITSGAHGDRQHCIYRGFCIQGCKVGAKQSTLVSHVPDAIRHGAEIRDNCMVARIIMGKDGRVTGVTYIDPDGKQVEQKAKVVIVSGYAIETPRLLLNSACPGWVALSRPSSSGRLPTPPFFPRLASSSGAAGRRFTKPSATRG